MKSIIKNTIVDAKVVQRIREGHNLSLPQAVSIAKEWRVAEEIAEIRWRLREGLETPDARLDALLDLLARGVNQ